MDKYIKVLHRIWDLVKKIFLRVVNFIKNILNFFKTPERLSTLRENNNIISLSIKENLDNGNYNIVNCLFDLNENDVIDFEEDALGIQATDIDEETKMKFGNKSAIFLS